MVRTRTILTCFSLATWTAVGPGCAHSGIPPLIPASDVAGALVPPKLPVPRSIEGVNEFPLFLYKVGLVVGLPASLGWSLPVGSILAGATDDWGWMILPSLLVGYVFWTPGILLVLPVWGIAKLAEGREAPDEGSADIPGGAWEAVDEKSPSSSEVGPEVR